MNQLIDQILQEPGVDAEAFSPKFSWDTSEQPYDYAPGDLLDKPDVITYLDDLHGVDRNAFRKAIFGLRELPGDVIGKYFGRDVLMLLAANAENCDIYERLLSSMEEQFNVDPMLFEKARLWEWQGRHCSSKGKDVVAQYEALSYVYSSDISTVDLHSLLKRHAREGVTISDARCEDYGLLPMVSEERFSQPSGAAVGWYDTNYSEDESFNIWLDAPVAVALTYKGRPQALIAVAANGPDELMIHQLQGTRANKLDPTKSKYDKDNVIGRSSARGLAPLQWQELMIGIGEQIAAGLGKKTLGIQAGEHNKWTKITLPRETEPHVSLDRAIEAYDVPAQRNGFERTETGDWSRPLRSIGRVAVAS